MIPNWKVASATVLIVYVNAYIKITNNFEYVANSIKPAVFFSVLAFAFNSFLTQRAFKMEFLSSHQVKSYSSELRKVLQELPEGVIIVDQAGEYLKFLNSKLRDTFNIQHFYDAKGKNFELQEIKKHMDEEFEKIYSKFSSDSFKSED